MKKIILFFVTCLVAFANEIQVFSTNTMHIELDSSSKIEKVFFGKKEDFAKNQEQIAKDLKSNLGSAVFEGSMGTLQASTGEMAKHAVGGGVGGVDPLMAVAAIGIMATAAGTRAVYDYAREDHEYIMLSTAVNSKGENTLLYTIIVANNAISNEEGIELGMKNIKERFVK